MGVIIVRQPNYMLAVGHNNPTGLFSLEGRIASGDTKPYVTFRGWGTYDDGDVFIDGNGLEAYDGYPTTAWMLGFATPNQDADLSNTLCSGGRSGLVTVRLVTNRYNTYANYNATIHLPKLADSAFVRNGKNIAGYKITFTRLVAI